MRNYFLLLIPVVCLIIGCSGNKTPITPEKLIESTAHETVSLGVSDWDPNGAPTAGMGTLGLFGLHIDLNNLSAELTPLRNNNLTDVLETVDITNFLTLAPCFDCVKIRSVSIDADGNLVLSIGIKHPFDAGNPLKPVTGKNRADLHVFNVEGIVVSNTGRTSFAGLGETIADFSLINADGFTGYLDASLDEIYPTDATVHPYITHFDDYSPGNFNALNPMGFESVTTPPPLGNLVMAMGCDYDFQDYIFAIETSMDFVLAVGCTYAVSAAGKADRFRPEYRIPQHNKKAASEISAEIISNDLVSGDITSTAELEVDVVDISHEVPTGDSLNQMLHNSSVFKIFIDVPGVTASPVSIDGSTAVSGTGHNPTDPLVYEIAITNTAAGGEGIYSGLVKVVDSYPPGSNDSPILNSMDGIKRVAPTENPLSGLFAISEFATFQTFKIEISTTNLPPVADAGITTQAYVAGQAAIGFDATGSYDPDGTIESYEWDFNDDGIFNGTGDEYTGNAWTPIHNFAIGVCVDIQLRVTDNRAATDELDSPITVCPFKNIALRPGVDISDVGTIEDTNDVLFMFEDHQVWKYNSDFTVGTLLYTMPGYPSINQRLEASSNGDSCCGCWDDTRSYWYSYLADGTQAAFHNFPWSYTPADPPHNFDLCVTYCSYLTYVPPLLHNLIGMFYEPNGSPAWARYGFGPSDYTSFYGNYSEDIGPGPNRIDIKYLKGVHALRSTTTYGIFYLEGEPEWRVEKSYILIGFTTGWGGTQTDTNTGFYNPQDITSDITSDLTERIFVLDILSTGERKIKKFSTTGTSFGSFGNNITMAADPNRLDASFASNWIYVTMDDRVSIFFPIEQP